MNRDALRRVPDDGRRNVLYHAGKTASNMPRLGGDELDDLQFSSSEGGLPQWRKVDAGKPDWRGALKALFRHWHRGCV